MPIHSIGPGPAPGLTRRDALRMAVAGSVGLGAAAVLPAFAATAPLKGNLKHSVARWTFPQQSIAQLCQTVKGIGFAAIDLVGPADWPTLKAHGVDSAMCNGAELGLTKGFAGSQFHDELVERYTRHIDLVADAAIATSSVSPATATAWTPRRAWPMPRQGSNASSGMQRGAAWCW